MLEQPGTHDVCGMFGKNASFVFWFLVIAVQEWRQVQVHLGRDEKWKSEEREGGVVATETKRVASHQFFGRGRNAFSRHSNAIGVMIPKKLKPRRAHLQRPFISCESFRKCLQFFPFIELKAQLKRERVLKRNYWTIYFSSLRRPTY